MRGLLASFLLVSAEATGSVGTVAVLEGQAWRTPLNAARMEVRAGSEIDLNDTIEVGSSSNVMLRLNDSSIVMLGARSKLRIDQASFEGSERRSFSARLFLGSLWANVSKLLSGSDAKFEISTDRAVAGVRGTNFRLDIVADDQGGAPTTLVRVFEGEVAVQDPFRGRTEVVRPNYQLQVAARWSMSPFNPSTLADSLALFAWSQGAHRGPGDLGTGAGRVEMETEIPRDITRADVTNPVQPPPVSVRPPPASPLL